MNTVDLHLHSTYSDGTYTPAELIHMAEMKGMEAIGITDHDTINHIKEVHKLGAKAKLRDVLAGVEVSAEFSSGTMHIVGYFVDPDNTDLCDMLNRFTAGRSERNPQIIEKLNALGVSITYDEVLKEANGASVGRPHIANVMVQKGAVRSMKEAFDKYLAKGAPAYVNRTRASSEKIIAVIKKAGGVSFLAHPRQLGVGKKKELERIVARLADEGLDGIEAYSSSHTREDVHRYEGLAQKYQLLLSGGSDFHGLGKEHIVLGFVGAGVTLSYDIIKKMKERIKVQ
ncbi:MAG: PHP domain-containing protein [Candidatus Omnitrophica bacterium]|nr:PHP domain-containing protein [Candidatus Omnitrophota bacterium]